LGVVPGELSMFERMTGAQLLGYLAALTGRQPTERADLLGRFALGSTDLAVLRDLHVTKNYRSQSLV